MVRAIEGLKKLAQSSTKYRGHSMRWGPVKKESPNFRWFTQNGSCRICGKGVSLITHPLPNETQISGEAVSLHCSKIGTP